VWWRLQGAGEKKCRLLLFFFCITGLIADKFGVRIVSRHFGIRDKKTTALSAF
jgi:hypothetical protein